ncbi:hypothetical protein PENSPDRAFT_623096 [Peniophora sp. CONT]|nr:hypothetical protein PENSPDRAFT_623096 [Peniophora sp. CONT]
MTYPPPCYALPQGYPSSHPPPLSFGTFASRFHVPVHFPPLVDFSGVTQGGQYLCPCRPCVSSRTRPYHSVYATAPPWEQHAPQPVRSPFLHRLLDGTRDVAGDPPLQVDMRAPILSLIRRGGALLSTSDWNAPATDPMIVRMSIVSDVMPKWPIDILAAGRPMSSYERPPVRCILVSDILCAVHASLQTPITQDEWAQLSRSEAARVSRAFKRRCDAYAVAGSGIRRAGVLRVDLVAGRCRFRGLVWCTLVKGVHRATLVLEDV